MTSATARAAVVLSLLSLVPLGCIAPARLSTAAPVATWITTALFFGQTEPVPGGGTKPIVDDQWRDFLARSVTPRFPGGFTVLAAEGQYRGEADGVVHIEPSRVVLLMHPSDTRTADDGKIHALVREYVIRFHQEDVLRSDWPAAVSFIAAPNPSPTR